MSTMLTLSDLKIKQLLANFMPNIYEQSREGIKTNGKLLAVFYWVLC